MRKRLIGLVLFLLCAGSLAVAVSWDRLALERERYLRSKQDFAQHITDVEIEILASGLATVSDVEVMAPGRLLVAERPGRVRLIENGRLRPEPYLAFDPLIPGFHTGLLDLLPAPDYSTTREIYLSYTPSHPERLPLQDKRWMRDIHNFGSVLTIARYVDTGERLENGRVIFEGEIGESDIEPGGRMTFGPDGKLYVAHGNFSHHTYIAQDLRSVKGKILRLNRDGTVPDDNPFVGRAEARPEIYSYGHKNPYGLVFDPATQSLIEVSHGPTGNHFRPKGWDEINIVRAGANYGWPWSWGKWNAPGTVPPAFLWQEQPSMAPGSAVFYRGSVFPAWNGSFLVTGLQSMMLLRFKLDGSEVKLVEKVMSGGEARLTKRLGLRPITGLGRLRGLAVSDDGTVYVGTSNGDRTNTDLVDMVVRLTPTRSGA